LSRLHAPTPLSTRNSNIKFIEAGSSEEALNMINENPVFLVLMDLRLPGMDGFEATRRIKAMYPDTCVIILTSSEGSYYRRRAAEVGADGYVVKQQASTDLIPAITSTLNLDFECL